jgi:hypothetical protein
MGGGGSSLRGHGMWQAFFDHAQGAPYYFNPSTGETLWTLPRGALVVPMTPAVNQFLMART